MIKPLFLFVVIAVWLQAKEYSGIIEPIKKVNLSFQINGVVSQKSIKEGDRVKRGGVIISLDDTIKKLDTQRKKLLYENNDKLKYLKKETEILHDIYTSNKELFEKSVSISKHELAKYEVEYYRLLGQYHDLKAQKKLQKTEYLMEKEVLQQHYLRSPFNGVISDIKFEVGEWVNAGEEAVEVVDSSTCYMETNIAEYAIKNIHVGDRLNISISSDLNATQREGKITFIAPVADSASGLVSVKIEFENKDYSVTPGVLGTIEL